MRYSKFMNKQQIIDKVKSLNLTEGSYVVFGSCPLALVGLREAGDVDMLVNDETFARLRQDGWREVDKGKDDNPLAHDVFEAHNSWKFSAYNPTLQHLLATGTVIDGVPFASLDEVRKWKAASGRPKDFADIELIDGYLSKNIDEVVDVWGAYVDSIQDWQSLVSGIAPKSTPCGPVYDIPITAEMSNRVNESFAISDMRNVSVAEPHYHTNGETEIYIVITGTGTTYVGGEPQELKPGVAVVTFPEIAHFTIPEKDLVLAVVNTPPFNPHNVVDITESDARVGFDKEQFESLKPALEVGF